MKKTILITLVVAIVMVNLSAWLVEYFIGTRIGLAFRIPLIIGIVFIATIFSGAAALINHADTERPNNENEDT